VPALKAAFHTLSKQERGITMSNMGVADRAVRGVVGTALVICGALLLAGAGQIAAIVIGAIFLLTGVIGFCPLYLPFGISTRKK